MERDSVSRIEIGTRFVTDYELTVLAKVLGVSIGRQVRLALCSDGRGLLLSAVRKGSFGLCIRKSSMRLPSYVLKFRFILYFNTWQVYNWDPLCYRLRIDCACKGAGRVYGMADRTGRLKARREWNPAGFFF